MRVAVVLGVLGLLQSWPTAAADEPVTSIGELALRRGGLVAIGRVVQVTPLGMGRELARVEVDEVLVGKTPRGGRALVMAPVLALRPGTGRVLVFLESMSPGSNMYLHGRRIFLGSEDGPAKIKVVRRLLEIEKMPDRSRRTAALRRMILANIRSSDRWLRWNALRELRHFLGSNTLAPNERRGLVYLALTTSDSLLGKYLRAVLAGLPQGGRQARQAPPRANPERPVDTVARLLAKLREATGAERLRWIAVLALTRDRRAAAALARGLADGDPAFRSTCAWHLRHYPGVATPRLLELARSDGQERVRRNALRALAARREAAAIGVLVGALRDPAVAADALFGISLYAGGRSRISGLLARGEVPEPLRDLARRLVGGS